MELTSLVGMIILIILGTYLLRAMFHSIRIIFFTLLVVLAGVYFFGISLNQLLNWILDVVLWVV